MNDSDRKILVKFIGEDWIEPYYTDSYGVIIRPGKRLPETEITTDPYPWKNRWVDHL